MMIAGLNVAAAGGAMVDVSSGHVLVLDLADVVGLDHAADGFLEIPGPGEAGVVGVPVHSGQALAQVVTQAVQDVVRAGLDVVQARQDVAAAERDVARAELLEREADVLMALMQPVLDDLGAGLPEYSRGMIIRRIALEGKGIGHAGWYRRASDPGVRLINRALAVSAAHGRDLVEDARAFCLRVDELSGLLERSRAAMREAEAGRGWDRGAGRVAGEGGTGVPEAANDVAPGLA